MAAYPAWRGMALAAVLTACAPIATKEHDMQIQNGTLANGMQVVVVPDHRAPVAVHSVWYTVGSVDEEEGRTGLSHMLEHMMFKGTDKYPYQTMDKIIQRNGGEQNAFTSRDMTAYHQTVAKEKLPLMMEIEADRMTSLKITDALLTPEKNVVLEERRMRTDSQPQSKFFEALLKAHYPNHPYGNPVIGWKTDIENYSLEALNAWYRRHYAPNNAMLLVVGDVTLDEVMPLAEKTYGHVPARGDVPPRLRHVEPARTAPVWVLRADKDVQVPIYYRLYRTPTLFQGVAGATPNLNDVVALNVLAEILGGGDAARLYQSLVVSQQLADAANADHDMVAAGEGTLDVQVVAKNGVPLDKVNAAVDAEVAKMQTEAVSDAELARAKAGILADTIYGQDDNDNLMYQVGSWVLAGGKVEDFNSWEAALKKVTAADVMRVAQTYLQPAGQTTAALVAKTDHLGTLAAYAK